MLTVAVIEFLKPFFQNCFVLQALSVIFFLSFIVQILYYYGAMQWVVFSLGWLLQKIMGTTVCESVNAAASIFLGMVIIYFLYYYFSNNAYTIKFPYQLHFF
jgi:nucleoside permease NupC